MRRAMLTASRAPALPPEFVSAGAITTTIGSIAKPASVISGDSVFLLLAADTGPISTPSGFTLVGNVTNASSDALYVFQRIIDGSEGSTFSATGSGADAGCAVAYRHVATGARVVDTTNSSSGSSYSVPAIASVAGDAAIAFCAFFALAETTPGTPSGHTARLSGAVDPGTAFTFFVADIIPAVTNEGAPTGETLSPNARSCVVRTAFAPA